MKRLQTNDQAQKAPRTSQFNSELQLLSSDGVSKVIDIKIKVKK